MPGNNPGHPLRALAPLAGMGTVGPLFPSTELLQLLHFLPDAGRGAGSEARSSRDHLPTSEGLKDIPKTLCVSLLSAALLLLSCGIPETEQNSYCQQIITPNHLAQLQELADTQMLHPGRVSFSFIHKEQLNDSICYVKAAFPVLGDLLGRTVFKENSSNAQRLKMVQRMYDRIDENVDPCIREEDDEERELSQKCLAEFSTSPYEMLVLVKRFFEDLAVLLQRREPFAKDCSHVYRTQCPSPRRPTASAPGLGTDPDGHVLSPALPPATQPSLSAASALILQRRPEQSEQDPEEPERRVLQGGCAELDMQEL
ncbi:PREDICTED: macrophage colony-stimulating factor 1 [Tinamus guttatus]|uniref:macrophage colony-stimulating factor 1 n=1 Tax=Tinamus guttatus TaxID=94827 RepID=UPI00052EF581|nr:PREDICTED: macrophage colony-stimulating factor 1 [Tinamus guttatus]